MAYPRRSPCPECSGRGKWQDPMGSTACWHCYGTGEEQPTREELEAAEAELGPAYQGMAARRIAELDNDYAATAAHGGNMASRRRQADDGTNAAAKPKRKRTVSVEQRTLTFIRKRSALQFKLTQLEVSAGAEVLELAELMAQAKRMRETKADEESSSAGGGSE